MIKIGYLSRISQVPVKTLRYYDEIGLLKPVEVDRFTGYRYYTYHQLTRLNRILALKDLGFSLEQISSLLEHDLPAAELRGMLRMKQAELRERLQEEAARLERVETRLKQIEQESVMSNYEVVLKKVEPILVAGVRAIIPAYPQQGHLWQELGTHLDSLGVTPSGACFTLYHSDEPEIDAEVCEPISNSIPERGSVRVHELPAVESMACTIHHGPFSAIGEAYKAILQWIDGQGYHIVGPGREIYLNPPANDGSQSDPETVTELQFPVSKA